MALAPLDELHFLTAALKAHVEWMKATGGHGVPACDATWLAARRDHYRRTPYVADATSNPSRETSTPPQFTKTGGGAAALEPAVYAATESHALAGVVTTALEGATPRVAASEDAALDGALIAETPALNETTALDETTAPAAVAAPTDAHAPESP